VQACVCIYSKRTRRLGENGSSGTVHMDSVRPVLDRSSMMSSVRKIFGDMILIRRKSMISVNVYTRSELVRIHMDEILPRW
jgi:hypothetical protein